MYTKLKFKLCLLCISAAYALAAQPAMGYWKGKITYKEKRWEIAVHIFRDADTLSARVNFLDIVAYEVPFSIAVNKNKIYLRRPQPNGKAVIIDGIVNDNRISGNFTGAGASNAAFTLYKAIPPAYIKEDMEIVNDTISLSGTLITPSGRGRYPLVVFIQGGSPDLRRVYLGSALEFVQKGFAAFIYDKRSVGKSNGGHWQTDGIKALASDAVAWVRQLKKNNKIDTADITVYGHSEGGWTAPMAATLCPDIKSVIVSGASAVNASLQTMYTKEIIMHREGFSDSIVNLAMGLWKQLYSATCLCLSDTTAALRENKAMNEKLNKVHNEPWFASSGLPYLYDTACPSRGFLDLLFTDPLYIWHNIKIPVLAVWGREDIIVPVDGSLVLLKETLTSSGNNNFTCKILSHLDHSGNFIGNAQQWDFPRTGRNFFSVMTDWLRKQRQNRN